VKSYLEVCSQFRLALYTDLLLYPGDNDLSLWSVAVNLGLARLVAREAKRNGVPVICLCSFDSGMLVVGVGALGLVL